MRKRVWFSDTFFFFVVETTRAAYIYSYCIWYRVIYVCISQKLTVIDQRDKVNEEWTSASRSFK